MSSTVKAERTHSEPLLSKLRSRIVFAFSHVADAQCPKRVQLLPKWLIRGMSVLPPIATEELTSRDVSNVPTADMPLLSAVRLTGPSLSRATGVFGVRLRRMYLAT
jgi:hypothetical protein